MAANENKDFNGKLGTSHSKTRQKDNCILNLLPCYIKKNKWSQTVGLEKTIQV